MTIPLQAGIVYGPVQSRRLGVSLGINILPDARKVCNFNCPYCQYGWTPGGPRAQALSEQAWPRPDAIAAALESALEPGVPVDRITLAGNGEPTLHPDFAAVVEQVRAVRDRRAPQARLAILSNASTIADPAVAATLGRLDERYMKLDAGDDATLRAMNGLSVPVTQIVEGLARLDGVILQSMFTREPRGRIDNTAPAALDGWLSAVRRVKPLAVHVYTVDRSPAFEALVAIPRGELEMIAERVRGLGIDALVF